MISRRTFVKATAASLAASTLPAYGLAPLTIGIGTFSYHTLSFDDMMAQLEILLPTNGLHNQQIEMSRGEYMLKHIDRSVTEAGLTFSIHNHFFPGVKFAYEGPEDVLNALAPLSANCGATADTGQFAACGYDPVDAIRKLAPRLNLVHLKDVKAVGHGDNVLLGSGIAKIIEVEAELHRQNFRRLVAIEYEKEGDDDVGDDMRTNVAFAWQ